MSGVRGRVRGWALPGGPGRAPLLLRQRLRGAAVPHGDVPPMRRRGGAHGSGLALALALAACGAEPGARVCGVVVEEAGASIAGAAVEVDGRVAATTDGSGRF